MKLLKTDPTGDIMPSDKITFVIDKELKTELKMIAVKKNTTITEIMTSFVREYVNENK